jgi:recombination protein RecR
MPATGSRSAKICGNYDTLQPCAVCQSGGRDEGLICVVEDVPDLWALERGGSYKGRYHVLGGVMSAVDGVTPDDLNIPTLISRVDTGGVREVILALNATFEGQNTAHYVADQLCRERRADHLSRPRRAGGRRA